MILLKCGVEEQEDAVFTIGNALDELAQKGINGVLARVELVRLCRNPAYVTRDPYVSLLIAHSLLLPDGTVHDSVRNIVISSFEGEGMAMKRVSPIMGY